MKLFKVYGSSEDYNETVTSHSQCIVAENADKAENIFLERTHYQYLLSQETEEIVLIDGYEFKIINKEP